MRVVVGGKFTLDGSLTANGGSASYDNQGGAAGGSIWVTAGQLAGEGTIAANGGTGEWVDGGSGGGGRIALYLTENRFKGTVTARGGAPGRQAGGAGTIYTRLAADPVGTVLVENGDRWGALTPLWTPEAFDLRIAAQAQACGAVPLLLRSLEVATNAVLTHLKGDGGVNVVVLGDMAVAGHINADGLGYPVGTDPGPGVGGSGSWAGGGAGHGGDGHSSLSGAPGGLAYGSALEPTTPGSQGGAGSAGPGTDGGGVIRLIIGGTLTVDGRITANALGSPATTPVAVPAAASSSTRVSSPGLARSAPKAVPVNGWRAAAAPVAASPCIAKARPSAACSQPTAPAERGRAKRAQSTKAPPQPSSGSRPANPGFSGTFHSKWPSSCPAPVLSSPSSAPGMPAASPPSPPSRRT
ncbi:MAG: hypothetical protein M5U12_37810 [Verrucomicrobia bacterium]|nr:hypothetical protein [Verrucomicrobiota bacterium]